VPNTIPAPPPASERMGYRMEEVAAALQIHVHTIRRMIDSGSIKTVRFGRNVIIPKSEMERLLTPKP
jgi:excisionase family DNA binding protein